MANINMDAVEALHVALQQSFSPDASVRDPAEAAIKNLKFVPGATQMLLHITEEKQVRFRFEFCCVMHEQKFGRWVKSVVAEIGGARYVSFYLVFVHLVLTSLTVHHLSRSNTKSAKPQPFNSKTSAVNAGSFEPPT